MSQHVHGRFESRRALPLLVFSLATASASPAHAQGYYSGTKGARAGGRAGAFTAKADDLTAVAHNPAGLARIQGTVVQVGNRLSYNAYEFTRAPTLDWGNLDNGVPPYVEFGTVRNEQPWQALEPFVGVASNLGLEDWGFALAAYAPAGVGKEVFPVDGGQRYMIVQRESIILNYTASAAWKHQDDFGLGASLQWISVPLLKYQLVIDADVFPRFAHPVSSDMDMLATVEGSDPFTLNAILGAWYRPAPFLELGLAGQVIPATIRTHSTLDIDPLSSTLHHVALLRDDEPADDVSLSLPLPLTAHLGMRYIGLRDQRELFDVELDLGYETWSRVDRFRLDTDGLVAELDNNQLEVGVIDVPKQWRDTLSVRLGGDYVALPDLLALRGGVFYESAAADHRYAAADFVGGQQFGGTLGLSVFVQDLELALAYEYREQPTVRVTAADSRVYQQVPGSRCQAPYTDEDNCHEQYLGQPAPPANAGSYWAQSHALSLDAMYRF
ncbi:MAG: outer membrane protein transport protein [Polyangiaceae bacterium]|nr:outer membrane protein transport protein [Polyangiaceae bacterium]